MPQIRSTIRADINSEKCEDPFRISLVTKSHCRGSRINSPAQRQSTITGCEKFSGRITVNVQFRSAFEDHTTIVVTRIEMIIKYDPSAITQVQYKALLLSIKLIWHSRWNRNLFVCVDIISIRRIILPSPIYSRSSVVKILNFERRGVESDQHLLQIYNPNLLNVRAQFQIR